MPQPELAGTGVLVTGGAGFIGSHLVDAAVAAGARVRVLDNLATGRRENLAHLEDEIELLEGDLRDTDVCRRACDGMELVFHQAALGSVPRSLKDPATSLAVNVSGTANLFAAARDAGIRRVVYASSSSVYGDSAELPKRVGVEGEPLSPYALSKKMNEDLARVFQRCYDMELVGLRYFNVFGPRQRHDGPYAAVIPRFFAAYREGRAPVIYGDGEQSRDFTYVGDAVSANLLAAGAPAEAARGAYNVASGRRATVNELAEWIRRLSGGGPAPAHEPPRKGDVRHSLADLEATTAGLEYRPQLDVESGLARLAEYESALAGRS
ncbi:MAG: NAD-dependent epimerase/dehydratase family protein [Acidobacteriota bacterium]